MASSIDSPAKRQRTDVVPSSILPLVLPRSSVSSPLSDAELYNLILSRVSPSAAPLPEEISKWMTSVAASLPVPLLPPPVLLSPFDSLPDDMVYVIGTYLDVPGIKSFALISKQFNDCVMQGFCFKDLALRLFPQIDELYSILPGARTYTEKLKQQFIALRKTRPYSGATSEREELKRVSKEAKTKKSLQEDYSFYLRFKLLARGRYDVSSSPPLKTQEKEDMAAAFNKLSDGTRLKAAATRIIKEDPVGMSMDFSEVQVGHLDKLTTATLRQLQSQVGLAIGVSVEKDVIIRQAEWDFGDEMSVNFNLLENAVEFPLWPKIEDYGLPGEDGYEEEKTRRHSFSTNDEDSTASSFVGFSVFVVKRESGETAPLVVVSERDYGGYYDSEFQDGEVVEWCGYYNSRSLDGILPPDTGCPDCGFKITPKASVRTRKTEGVGGVPELVSSIDNVNVQFQVELRWVDSDKAMDLSVVAATFKNLFAE